VTLFRLLSWPYFRKHVLRTVLTTAGIVLGVAVFVALRAANQSVLSAFAATVDGVAGKTQLQVTAGGTGFNEDILEKAQAASTVAVAVPIIEAIVDSNLPGQGNLLVLGVDMTGDRSLRDYDLEGGDEVAIDDPLIFLAQPDSLIVSQEFAANNHLGVGSAVQLGTAEGEKQFTIRGVMKASGLASAFGGSLAVMDIYAAQKMFGRGRTFDRIDLAVKPGVALAAAQTELADLLGPAFQVEPPSSRGQQFESMLAGYTIMVGISSAFALFIGLFIIFNAFAISITQRRSDIGVLRALGATRGQILRLFLGEAAIMGLFGSLVGIGVGLLTARALLATISTLISNAYGVAQRAESLSTSPWAIAGAALLGILTSVVAAVLPARAAARVDPVQALKKGKYQAVSALESRTRALVALGLAAVSAGCMNLSASGPVFYVGYILLLIVAVLVVPALSVGVARMIRPLLRRIRPVEGALAADSLIHAPRRVSASVTALMLSLALVMSFDGMSRASYRSITRWMNTTLDPDLFVLPSAGFDNQTTRFPAVMAAEMSALSGIADVQMVRNSRITYKNTPVMVVAIEVESISRTARPEPVDGNADDMYRRAAAGQGLIVSDNFAQLQRVTVGDVLEIPAPYGIVRLPIVGTVVDYSDQQGSIIVDRSVFLRYWHDDSVNIFRIYVKPGSDVAVVRQAILRGYAGRRQVFVMTNAALRSYITGIAGQWFGLTSVQIAVAVLVAILGIVNTLTVSVTDRRRELGVLRAVGALRSQVRLTVCLEAVSIGSVGLVLGYALGAINLHYILQIVQHDVTGMRLDYAFPLTTALQLAATILGTAFVAALWPARIATRGSLVEALEYE
jgi:putative ABC transport system permease protein